MECFLFFRNFECFETTKHTYILVRVLTHTAPQYWAKECTGRCIRHSSKLYYTPQFANLLFSLLLTNEARIKKSVNTLLLHFGTTCIIPGLLPKNRVVWNEIANDLIQHEVVLAKLKEMKYRASQNGEFEVISHDETFKIMFCLIGQNKMSQKKWGITCSTYFSWHYWLYYRCICSTIDMPR